MTEVNAQSSSPILKKPLMQHAYFFAAKAGEQTLHRQHGSDMELSGELRSW